jgi:hypothetical protein
MQGAIDGAVSGSDRGDHGAHGGGANAIGANVQAILCMKLSPDKVETSTLPLP